MHSYRIVRFWPILAALAAGTLLATAHAFETFGGYPPCELCLKQRDVYWAILVVGIVLAALTWLQPRTLRGACAVLALLFFAEAAVALYHSGVEWKWWPGPKSCTSAGVHTVSLAAMSDLLSGKPQRIVLCDVAAWRLLDLSMAGWNAVAAIILATVSSLLAGRRLR